MTDREIVDALGQCERMTTCSGCPYFEKVLGCKKHLYQDAFHLINRQKEEIEKLKTQLNKRENFYTLKFDKDQLENTIKDVFETYEVDIDAIRNEAIKEFAETLKQKKYRLFKYDEGGWSSPVFVVNVDDIDKLIKEIAGIVKCKDCKYFSNHPDHCYRLASDDVDEDFWCKYGEK